MSKKLIKSPNNQPKKTTNRIVSFSIVILALFLLTFSISRLVSPEAGGSDSAGYLLNSKVILGEFKTTDLTPTPSEKLNCGDLDQMLTARLEASSDCKTYSRLMSYPVGLSILHTVATSVFGDNDFGRSFSQSVTFVGTLTILYLFVFRLTRRRLLAISAPILYLVSKVAIFSLNSNLSDVPGAFWIVLSTYIAYLLMDESEHSSKESKPRYLYFVLAPSLWFLVLTREVNALAAIPLTLIILRIILKTRFKFLFWLLLSGIPFMYIRYKVNGTWLTPSYGTGIFQALSPKWFWRGFGNEFYFIASNLGLLFFTLLIPKLKWNSIEKIMFSQVAIMFSFYAFYQWTGETWWDGRFILSVFPVFIVLTFSRYHQFSKMYLSKKYVGKLRYSSSNIKSSLITLQIVVLVFVNLGIHFPNSSSPYRYLIFEMPKFRNVHPVIDKIRETVPQGSSIVTMDLSASGRYYFGSTYKFMWQPALETLQYSEIVKNFPKTYWVFNSQYVRPPEELYKRMKIIGSTGNHEIGLLE